MPAWPSLNYRVRVEQTNSLQEKKHSLLSIGAFLCMKQCVLLFL